MNAVRSWEGRGGSRLVSKVITGDLRERQGVNATSEAEASVDGVALVEMLGV